MIKRMSGVVLTYVNNLDELEDCVRRGGYDTVKVVTRWGVDQGGWSPPNKTRLFGMAPNIIVRTVAGDPSTGNPGENDFPDPDKVQQEIAEWYQMKPDIFIEIGNEPNIRQTDDDFYWKYRYFLAASIERCRQVFPKAKLIAPAPILGPEYNARRFCEINQDAMSDCDYIGLHVYEFYGFHAAEQPASTGQLQEAIDIYKQLFNHKPWFITEYGINDNKQVNMCDKGQRYAKFIHFNHSHPPLPGNVKGAVYYHLGMKGDLHPEYHIYQEGDDNYRGACAGGASPSFGVSFGVGGGTTSAPPAAGDLQDIIDPIIPQVADTIATLSRWEHEVIRERAESSRAAEFLDDFDYQSLQQVQALRAILESALMCAQGDTKLTRRLVDTAESLVKAWDD